MKCHVDRKTKYCKTIGSIFQTLLEKFLLSHCRVGLASPRVFLDVAAGERTKVIATMIEFHTSNAMSVIQP
jgi:hypothetical protein